jgi:hypothetical protein
VRDYQHQHQQEEGRAKRQEEEENRKLDDIHEMREGISCNMQVIIVLAAAGASVATAVSVADHDVPCIPVDFRRERQRMREGQNE